ncbi:PAS domain-containing protein [Alicyclobacillus tolerans]|uniref:helix-turn-helix transcriptional regulator n=1 Tax=Alicyclobacillus tolerans TaxID=90970 RepID=UPI001F229336|nr:PAS domain-containing protein [Alicyclobacillus tolerans]MCF8565553.1 PAS domain-containing protein [Alicyclobacillus tolerans]
MEDEQQPNEFVVRLIPVAEAMAETFGSRCEVVLHDLTRPQSSVVFVKNGHVTGRSVGQSFRHLFQQVLTSKKFHNDYVSNYKTVTPDGRVVKSTTALIRDNHGVTVGAFCVNVDIDNLLPSLSTWTEFVRLEEDESAVVEREVIGNVWDVVTDMIHHAVKEYPVPPADMTKADKLRVVSFLNEKGLFLIKGAIDEVAESLEVSKVTIYGYLEELKGK